MNNERYNQIIDEVFKKYGDSHWTPPENPNGPLLLDQLWSLKPMKHSKEGFINECKTDKEFSEKWGLKIEEQELSVIDRIEYYGKHFMTESESKTFDELRELDYDKLNVPTKLITVTYNNETIEVYE